MAYNKKKGCWAVNPKKFFGELLSLINDGIWRKNATVLNAVGLFLLISYGVTLKNGVILSFITVLLLVPMCIVAPLIRKVLKGHLFDAVLPVLSAALFIPVLIVTDRLFKGNMSALGICLWFVHINAFLYFRTAIKIEQLKPLTAAISGLANGIGFAVIICLIGMVREMAAFGTVWGYPLRLGFKIPAFSLPFSGFILLAFVAAAFNAVAALAGKAKEMEAEKNEPVN